MLFRYLLLFFTLFATINSARSQAWAGSDYLVTNDGDTLRGKLLLTRFVTERGVLLETDANTPARSFTAAQSRGFGTADGRRFVRQFLSFENQELRARGAVARIQAVDSIPVFLQVVATGKARLYLLDYHLTAERKPLEYTEYETSFIYLQMPKRVMVRLREATFRDVLREQLPACPAAEGPIRDARFAIEALAQVVQAYNTACGTGYEQPKVLPLAARQARPANRRFGTFGVSGGVALGTVKYSPSEYESADEAALNWTVGISCQGQGKGHWGVVSGLYLTSRSGQALATRTVPSSYVNQGASITFRQKLAVWSVQVPLLAQYVTIPAGGTQFFATIGPVLGTNIRNTSTQEVAINIYVPGQFLPAQGSEVLNLADYESAGTIPSLGGQAGVGVRRKVGDRTLVGELYFERGQELSNNVNGGKIQYQGAGLRIGFYL